MKTVENEVERGHGEGEAVEKLSERWRGDRERGYNLLS